MLGLLKKKVWIGIVCIFLVALFFSVRKPLERKFFSLAVHTVSKKALGDSILVSSIKQTPGSLVLENLTFGQNNHAIDMSAKSLTIFYEIDWWHRRIELELEFDTPDITLKKCEQLKEELAQILVGKIEWLDIRLSIRAKSGKLLLKDGENQLDFPIHLETKQISQDQSIAHFSSYKEDASLKCYLNTQGESHDLKIAFDQLDLEELLNLSRFIAPLIDKQELKIEKIAGKVKGSLETFYAPNQFPIAKLRLEGVGINFSKQEEAIVGQIPHLLISSESLNQALKEPLTDFREAFHLVIRNSAGTLKLPKGALIQDMNGRWQAGNVHGTMNFHTQKTSLVELFGVFETEDQGVDFKLKGQGYLWNPKGDLSLTFVQNQAEDSKIKLSLSPLSQNRYKLMGQIENFSTKEICGVQKAFGNFSSLLDTFTFQSGHLDLRLSSIFSAGKLLDLNIGYFDLKEANFKTTNYVDQAKNLSAYGNLDIHFNTDSPLKTLNGQCTWSAESLEIGQWPLENFSGKARVELGELLVADFEGDCKDIRARGEWNHEEEAPLKLTLNGQGSNFLKQAPASIQEAYSPLFSEDHIHVDLLGNYTADLIDLGLVFCIQENQIHLDVQLAREEKKNQLTQEFECIHQSFIKPLSILPAKIVKPSSSLFRELPFKVVQGGIRAKQIDVKKYLSPMLFGRTTIVFSGTTDFEGTFDQDSLNLEYYNYDFNLEHQDVSISVQDKENKRSKHYFNFSTGSHFGEMDVKEALCRIKGNDLDFKPVFGKLKINPSAIYCDALKASCVGLPIVGQLAIDFLGDGNFNLSVSHAKLQGPFDQFANLLNGFGLDALMNLPLSADIEIEPSSNSFKLFRREDYSYLLDLEGRIKKGVLSNQPIDEIDCAFKYNSKQNTLTLARLKGKWQPAKDHEFFIESPHLLLAFDSMVPTPLHLRIKDQYQDQARLKGELLLNLNQPKLPIKLTLKDEKNYFGALKLGELTLRLQKDFSLDFLYLDFKSELEQFFDPHLIQSILLGKLPLAKLQSQSNLKGQITGQWIFDRYEDKHKFYLWGDQVQSKELSASPLQIKGHAKGPFIRLEEFTYRDYKASCRLEKKPYSLFIQDLRLQGPEGFYLDVSGAYCQIFNSFNLHVHKLHGSISKIPFLSNSLSNSLVGALDMKGEIRGGYFKNDWVVCAHASSRLHQLKAQDFEFTDDLAESSFELKKGRLIFPKVQAKIKSAYGHPLNVDLCAQNIEIKKEIEKSSVDQILFSLKAEELSALKTLLTEKFSIPWPKDLILKEDGYVKGAVSYHPHNVNYSLFIRLDEDVYRYGAYHYPIKQLSLKYGDEGLLLKTHFAYEGYPYQLELSNYSSNQETLYCRLTSSVKKSSENHDALVLKCDVKEGERAKLRSISGQLSGLKIDLMRRVERDQGHRLAYMGQIEILNDEVFSRFPKKIAETFEKLDLGSGYFLSGQFYLNSQNLKDYSFEGLLGGGNFNFMGYEFKSLSSQLSLNPNEIKIKDLKVSDLSGILQIPEIKIYPQEKKTLFSIPKTTVKDFKPSLLHKKGEGTLEMKPLIIPTFELLNLKGDFSSRKSIEGTGTLTFLKSTKKQSTLLDIPAHLLSKLGLDLSMLNPVEGKVQLEIRDEKINFVRFVDVYSHDRRCHFQLAKSPEGAYLDFNGNIHMRIKMKQYVLLKITEPFLISIKGPFKNPKFSLMRKKIKVDVPQKVSQ